jgi:hypothetical protein
MNRADFATKTAAYTLVLRYDIFPICLALTCRADAVYNMGQVFFFELSDCADYRIRGSFPKSAKSCGTDGIPKIQQTFDGHLSSSGFNDIIKKF